MHNTSLIIGSAQLGMDYGIAKKSKKILSSEFSKILDLARNNGVNQIDTAFSYGSSHKELGKIGISDFKITTKLPPLNENKGDIKELILKMVYRGLNDLKINKIEYLLLHHSFDILGKYSEDIIYAIESLKAEGAIKGFGYSVYTPDELDKVYKKYQPDIVQIPLSLFDNRMLDTGWLAKLKLDKVNIIARSVFLQGVILMNKDNRNIFFSKWDHLFNKIEEVCSKKGISKTDLALLFTKNIKELDGVIVGMESLPQFNQIIQSWVKKNDDLNDKFSCSDENLLDPLKWEIN